MFYILITGIIMAIASAAFWCIEALPFFQKMKSLKAPTSTNPLKVIPESLTYLVGVTHAITSLWTLALDIICTVWLVSSFGFTGMVGGVIGITISNVISIFLLYQSRKSPRR